jgi:hypothetical protein
MAECMMIHQGGEADTPGMLKAHVGEVMTDRGTGMQQTGPALADTSTPLGPGISIADNGMTGTATSLTRSSIVENGGMDCSQALASDHSFRVEGTGTFAIDVYGLMPVPIMD